MKCPYADVDKCCTVVWLSCTVVFIKPIYKCDFRTGAIQAFSILLITIPPNHPGSTLNLSYFSAEVSPLSVRAKNAYTLNDGVHVCSSTPIVVSSIMTLVAVHKRNQIEIVRVNATKYWLVKMSRHIFFLNLNRQNCQTVKSLYIDDGSFYFNSLSSRYPV